VWDGVLITERLKAKLYFDNASNIYTYNFEWLLEYFLANTQFHGV